MPKIDHHDTPYDAETLLKLDIFEKYFESWLPVFIKTGYKSAYVFDFFAGPGLDMHGQLGSPMRLIKVVKNFLVQMQEKNFKLKLIFNEKDKDKYTLLEKNVSEYCSELSLGNESVKCSFHNNDFKNIFDEYSEYNLKKPNLMFIDQSGIKMTNREIFLKLIDFTKTDFLFFISSSYARRFEMDLRNILPNIKPGELRDVKHHEVHRFLALKFSGLIPESNKAKIYPFSIKKGANIYGLIFGAKHIRGVDKFLKIAWKKNEINGEANYDIDGEIMNLQKNLFEEEKPTKKDWLREKILELFEEKYELTNKQIFDFSCLNGFHSSIAVEILQALKKEKKIEHFSWPKLNYKKIYKEKDIITFKVKE